MLKHSVPMWISPFGSDTEKFMLQLTTMGVSAVELVSQKSQLSRIRKVGLEPLSWLPILESESILTYGWNGKDHHQALCAHYRENIIFCGSEGIGQIIVFSGNQIKNQTFETSVEIMVPAFFELAEFADKYGVTLVFEGLNSRQDHPGYECDTVEKSLILWEEINHPRFKLLLDCYHLKQMGDNPEAFVKRHINSIAHIHFAGLRARLKPNDADYEWLDPVVSQLIGGSYRGYLGHEYHLGEDTGLEDIRLTVARLNHRFEN